MNAAVLTLIVLILLLAWTNGANDVAKGVATLAGSGAASARRAIWWGGACTVLGGLAAVTWGGALVTTFSTGFLSPGYVPGATFLYGVVIGACAWLVLATARSLPISTTHALLGGIVGAALATAGPGGLQISAVAQKALLPLLLSPLIAVLLCALILHSARWLAARVPAWRPGCCAEAQWQRNPYVCGTAPVTFRERCYQRAWPALHWLSSGVTSFARGLNDTPKIAAPLLMAMALLPGHGSASQPNAATAPMLLIVLAMGAGSVWGGQRVLRVLAHRVAALDPGTGLTANVGTSLLVLLATPLGLPVSTTHVSTGALLGIRWARKARPDGQDALKMILFGWVVTLPVAALVAALGVWVIKAI